MTLHNHPTRQSTQNAMMRPKIQLGKFAGSSLKLNGKSLKQETLTVILLISFLYRESKWKARKLQQLESTSSSDITMPKRETQEEFGAVVCSSSLINVETSNDGEMFNFGSGTCTETGFQKDDDRNTRTSFNDMGCGTDEHNIDTETQTDHKITRHDVECGTDELAVNVSTQTDDSDSDMDHRDVSCGTDELNLSVETQTYDLDRSNDVIIDIPEEMVPIRSSRPTKNFSPLTELKVVKFGTDWKFNFIGAFLDFDSLDKKEIMKVQKMLMDTSYEVCERARCVKKLKALKDGLTA